MEVILLKSCKQGRFGNIIKVKDGFGRNYLIPRGIAQRATQANKEAFAAKKDELEAANLALLESAEALRDQMIEASVTIYREASNDMKLYGSVSQKDIAQAIMAKYSIEIDPKYILINHRIKNLGSHEVKLQLHPDLVIKLDLLVVNQANR
jgi:large subunit ribosomal protein L9